MSLMKVALKLRALINPVVSSDFLLSKKWLNSTHFKQVSVTGIQTLGIKDEHFHSAVSYTFGWSNYHCETDNS